MEAYADTSVLLKPTERLSPASPTGEPVPGPTHVEAEHITGHDQREMVAEGDVMMRNLREQLQADWVRYDQDSDVAEARGHVVFMRGQNRLEGSALKLKLEARLGEMKDVNFQFTNDDGKRLRGGAKTLSFNGPDVYQLAEATYTTCAPGNEDWLLKTDQLHLDYISSVGTARHVQVRYMDIPILYAPWMDFALDDKRKSGFLAPSYGASDSRGLELFVPWYWNIAPHRDATLMPRLMTKRGLQLGGEFRYLESSFSGELAGEALPDDKTTNTTRTRFLLRHRQQFDARWSGSLDYETVSDDRYFADLSSAVNQTSQVNLPQQLTLNYSGEGWRVNGLLQRYQTLQDPAAIVVEPYHRLPQINLTAGRDRLWVDPASPALGARFDLNSQLVVFEHPANSLVQGSRIHANPSLAFPFQTPFSVVTPRLGWYLSQYTLDESTLTLPDSLSAPVLGSFRNTTRSLPSFSLDSSLFLEREVSLLDGRYTQTIEPRAYYVFIPYRDQRGIPVFDSSIRDLSLDQLFTENQYIGVDRINDANQLTLAMTSRFLDSASGAERLQMTLGQRFYFTDQRVLFPGQSARSSNTTELLALASGQVNARLRLNAGIQYDTGNGILSKANLGSAWTKGPGKVFNADYRYTKDSLQQVDFSFQWPLAAKWYGLGRLNYSILDKRMIEALGGFEYNAGCWSLRGVMQQLATTETTTTSAFFLQLELRGLTKLGPNPLEVLKRSITGYARSSEIQETPVISE